MLSGSLASAYYGAARSTQDIDIVVAAESAQIEHFIGSLPTADYYADLEAALQACKHQSLFNVIDLKTGWKIDLIIRKSRAFSQTEFERRQCVEIGGMLLYIATAEDIVISKLEWSKLAESTRQVEDVAGILRLRWNQLDFAYLERWIRELEIQEQWAAALKTAGVSR